MDLAQLEQEVEAAGQLVLDVSLSEELPGYVRSVSLRRGKRVAVEFDQYGHDEGGVYFLADFSSFASAVAALESFLGKSASAWRSCETDYPPPPADLRPGRESHDMVVAALRNDRIQLPSGARFRLGSGYWGQYWRGEAGTT